MTLNWNPKSWAEEMMSRFFPAISLFACTLGVTKMISDFGGHRPEV